MIWKSFHMVFWGTWGYVPGVCWNFLRYMGLTWFNHAFEVHRKGLEIPDASPNVINSIEGGPPTIVIHGVITPISIGL